MMRKAYPMQMDRLAHMRSEGGLIIETMGETGRRFKRSFKSTPTQAQVVLMDPFGNDHAPERTVWYQSKYLRVNLHFRDNQFYLRDLHVYDDRFPEPYLTQQARQHGIEQRMLAVLDGYHWSDDEVHAGRAGLRALGRFVLIEQDGSDTALAMVDLPTVSVAGTTLRTIVHLSRGGKFVAVFHEREIAFSLIGAPPNSRLGLMFEWVANRSALQDVSADRLKYRFRDYDYTVGVVNGVASKTIHGIKVVAGEHAPLRLLMTQAS